MPIEGSFRCLISPHRGKWQGEWTSCKHGPVRNGKLEACPTFCLPIGILHILCDKATCRFRAGLG